MAIEAMKGAGMSYAGSSSASDVKAESQAKVETASNAAASDDLMKKTIQIDTKETDKNGKDGNRDDSQAQQTISENSQIKKAVDEINKKAHNSEAVFGIHDATNRVTIKIVDKDTKKVLKEYPPEKPKSPTSTPACIPIPIPTCTSIDERIASLMMSLESL